MDSIYHHVYSLVICHVFLEVLTAEHFELREALPTEEEAQRLKAKFDAEALGQGEVPLRVLLAQGEAATVVGKLGANVSWQKNC